KQPLPAKQTELLRRLEEAPARERYNLLITSLQREVAGIMGFEPPQLPGADQGIFEMGMDSLKDM
ncbi:MAG: acyl carrier protein, partial [Deltaproteobacteria bacterium]